MQTKLSKYILIVDDSPDMQSLLKVIFESKGYTTESTNNGAEALALLRSREQLPDLILLDLAMPVMDGYAFREQQKKDLKLKDIPIVVMTGHDELKDAQMRLDADEIVLKPLHMKSILDVIKRNSYLH